MFSKLGTLCVRLLSVVNSVGCRDLCVYSCLIKLKFSLIPRFPKMMCHEIKQHSFWYSWAWKIKTNKQTALPFIAFSMLNFGQYNRIFSPTEKCLFALASSFRSQKFVAWNFMVLEKCKKEQVMSSPVFLLTINPYLFHLGLSALFVCSLLILFWRY